MFRRLFTCLAVFCLLAAQVGAETLAEAWERAEANSSKLRAAYQEVEASDSSVRSAEAVARPDIVISGLYNQSDDALNRGLSDAISVPLSGLPLAAFSSGFSVDQSVGIVNAGVSMPVFTSGRIKAQLEGRKFEKSAQVARADVTRNKLRMDVAEAYLQVLRSQSLLKVAHSQSEASRAHTEDARNLLEQGVVPERDLLSAEVAESEAEQNLLLASNRLQLATAAYNRLLGRELSETVDLDLPEELEEPGELETLQQTALERRPELAVLTAQQKAILKQARAWRGEYGPQVSFLGGYTYIDQDQIPGRGSWSAGLLMQWRLSDGGVVEHKARSLEHKADALDSEQKEAYSLIQLEVLQAWLAHAEAKERIDVLQHSVAQAEEQLRISEDRYRLGLAPQTETFDARALALRAQINHSNAKFDLIEAGLRLRYAAGEL